MKEVRVQINSRVNKDMNVSVSFTHIVDDDTDMDALGQQDQHTLVAYLAGFGRESETS